MLISTLGGNLLALVNKALVGGHMNLLQRARERREETQRRTLTFGPDGFLITNQADFASIAADFNHDFNRGGSS